MKIYHKILVTMDCTSVDDNVISHVADLAVQNEAEIILLHVIHSHTLGQERALRAKAEKSLKKRIDDLKEREVNVSMMLKSGEPDEEILKVIRENDYDLVAMGTHGHSFLGDFLYGSVSRTLKHHIDIPLLLIGSS
jgi:nucleotide-binding universal stress UspA family protein